MKSKIVKVILVVFILFGCSKQSNKIDYNEVKDKMLKTYLFEQFETNIAYTWGDGLYSLLFEFYEDPEVNCISFYAEDGESYMMFYNMDRIYINECLVDSSGNAINDKCNEEDIRNAEIFVDIVEKALFYADLELDDIVQK